MTDLLIEIYSEEIPSRMQQKAAEDFKKIFKDFFDKQNIVLAEEDFRTFVTPRRLGLLVHNLTTQKIIPSVNKIGPRIDAPSAAIDGFIKSIGVKDISDLTKITRDNNQYYSYNLPETKINTKQLLEKNLADLLQKMCGLWPKSMDLIDLNKKSTWIRPIRNILAIFGEEIVNFEFANLKSNNQTFGHLLAGKKALQINKPSEYKEKLENHFVIVDWNARRNIISKEISKIDSSLVEINSKLIDEITGLVEYPQILVGGIDSQFNNLPKEVLDLTIKNNQKSIPFNNNESLNFIFVSNIKADTIATKKIIADNEKVVRARLSDAKFYIEEDLKSSFKDRVNLLKSITFHKKLGSLHNKIKRLETLNKLIAIWVPQANLNMVEKLKDLAKNDLTTKTVAELPELQGIIGGYYAKIQGEAKEIYEAICEQYLPVGQNSKLPKTPLGIVLALSDKIDNICSLFIVDEKPTASKDPFALRRAALGIIKILFEREISLPLKIIIDKAINNFPNKFLKVIYQDKSNAQIKVIKNKLSIEILNFFIERNKAYLKDQHKVRTDIINQIFDEYNLEKNNKKYNPLITSKKAIFINNFVSDSANSNVIELCKRSANIVSIEEKKDQKEYNGKVSIISLKDKYEKILYKKTKIATNLVKKALRHNDYQKATSILADLEFPIKDFFNNVEVNCENKHFRSNRLIILARIGNLFNQIFDFSKIETK
jgi:glycyl-tRNA synthetase beta chain